MFAEHLVCPVLYSLSWEVWKHRLAVPLCLLSSAPGAGSIPEQGAEPTARQWEQYRECHCAT